VEVKGRRMGGNMGKERWDNRERLGKKNERERRKK